MRSLFARIIFLFAILTGDVDSKSDHEWLPRLHVADNGRFLVTEEGKPFFWLADTAWSIINQPLRESSVDQPGVELYFQHRQKQGFNVLQTHFLTNLVRGPIDAPNAYGHAPFIDGDFMRPRVVPGAANDYWDYADTVIDLAGRYGMYVAIVAAWTNSLETDEHPMIRDPDVAYGYGYFLGERYRERNHLIWLLGGDAFGRPDRASMSSLRLRMTQALAEWNVFAGGLGHTYGHRNLIGWVRAGDAPLKHGADRPWFESLDAAGAQQMKHLKALVESRPILIRVPDPSLVVSVQGESSRPIQATRGADGSYAFFYLPTGEPVTIDLDRLSGKTIDALWYNPRGGKSSLIDTIPSTGYRQFTPPTGGPGEDWILVLDDTSCNFPPPGTGRNVRGAKLPPRLLRR